MLGNFNKTLTRLLRRNDTSTSIIGAYNKRDRMSEVVLSPTTINGHHILFEPIRAEDLAPISNLLLHNYIPDQRIFRAIGSGERLRLALATPNSRASEAFLRETHEYLLRKQIDPAIKSVPNVSFKVVCKTNGELIGVSLGEVVKVAECGKKEYISH